jgi:hypothetical protein
VAAAQQALLLLRHAQPLLHVELQFRLAVRIAAVEVGGRCNRRAGGATAVPLLQRACRGERRRGFAGGRQPQRLEKV